MLRLIILLSLIICLLPVLCLAQKGNFGDDPDTTQIGLILGGGYQDGKIKLCTGMISDLNGQTALQINLSLFKKEGGNEDVIQFGADVLHFVNRCIYIRGGYSPEVGNARSPAYEVFVAGIGYFSEDGGIPLTKVVTKVPYVLDLGYFRDVESGEDKMAVVLAVYFDLF